MSLRVDHLVVTAETLDDGAAWVHAQLGAVPQPGGAHPLMGTHNRLLSLGPDCYLEVIAIDPAAPPPDRARWFGLDTFSGPPRLAGWVARPQRLDAPAGTEISAQRRGDLRWRITLPQTGVTMAGGAWPLLIEWEGNAHPAGQLTDCGLRLARLELAAPDWPAWTEPGDNRIVRRRDTAEPLRAVITGPGGTTTL